MQKNPSSIHVKFHSPNGNLFYHTLRKRVETYFETNQTDSHANAKMIWKSVILISLYILPFLALGLTESPAIQYLLWILMGIAIAGIGMSVMHDANHGAYSSDKRINFIMGHTLNLLGGSAFNWKLQHNILHHTYTNISNVDEDIQDRLVLKFSPHTQ